MSMLTLIVNDFYLHNGQRPYLYRSTLRVTGVQPQEEFFSRLVLAFVYNTYLYLRNMCHVIIEVIYVNWKT